MRASAFRALGVVLSILHESSKIDCRSLYKICGTLKNSDIISVKATVKERNGVRDLDSSAFPTFVLVYRLVLRILRAQLLVILYSTFYTCNNTVHYVWQGILEDYIMKIKSQDKIIDNIPLPGFATLTSHPLAQYI